MRRVALGLGLMMESPSLDNSGSRGGASITKGRIQGEVRTSTGAALGFVFGTDRSPGQVDDSKGDTSVV